MSNTKDIEIKGKVKIIKDYYATYGKWKKQKKLFSATVEDDFDECVKFVELFPLMRMHYNYIVNSNRYEDFQEKVAKEKKKLTSKPKKEKPAKEPKNHAVLMEK